MPSRWPPTLFSAVCLTLCFIDSQSKWGWPPSFCWHPLCNGHLIIGAQLWGLYMFWHINRMSFHFLTCVIVIPMPGICKFSRKPYIKYLAQCWALGSFSRIVYSPHLLSLPTPSEVPARFLGASRCLQNRCGIELHQRGEETRKLTALCLNFSPLLCQPAELT